MMWMQWQVRLAFFLSVGVVWLSCSSHPDFGTLPRVEVPIEPAPKKEEPPEKKQQPKAKAKAPVVHDPADPRAVRSKEHVDMIVGFSGGELSLISHSTIRSKLPEPTARRIGRFAAELWVGRTLLERARFDFPLLAGTDDGMESGLSATARVRLPNLDRATRLRIVDRKTREALLLAWPLESSPGEGQSGGAAGAPSTP